MEQKPNPYRAPLAPLERQPREPINEFAPTVAYSIIGAMLGTVLMIPLVLSGDPAVKLQGGLLIGAPNGGLIGYLLGRRKQRPTH